MSWRAQLSDGRKILVEGYSFSDGLRAAQKLDPTIIDVDQADECPGRCYCGDVDSAGYTYDDEYGSCHHCNGDCDCTWFREGVIDASIPH